MSEGNAENHPGAKRIKKTFERIGDAVLRRHKNKYWEIDFSHIAGRRVRFYREFERDARELASAKTKEFRAYGALASELTSQQRVEAAMRFKKLEGVGVTLTAVVERFLATHPSAKSGKMLREVIDDLVRFKIDQKLSSKYTAELNKKLYGFEQAFPSRRIASIAADDIRRWSDSHRWSEQTKQDHIQKLNVLFNHAWRRGFVTANPCQSLLNHHAPARPAVVLAPQQVRTLLATCTGDKNAIDCVPYLAIGFFTGMRVAEIRHLHWREVDIEKRQVRVERGMPKGRSPRVLDLTPNLVAWLRPFAGSEGHVVLRPVNEIRAVARGVLKLPEWPHDTMRYTFAAHHLARFGDRRATAIQLGCEEKDVMLSRIMNIPDRTQADAYWQIFPPQSAPMGRPLNRMEGK